ncbi:MAG: 5-formyltetrahydrofolate cyclo-ligase [Balneolaceae bacterium]|nr:5-formyltetrahydrofolate cyclo-ligase [Balneolaceae bacterium]
MGANREKERLRAQLLEQRNSLTEAKYRDASEEIVARLQELPEIRNARTVHCYVSMNERREVDTHLLLRWLLASNKRVVVPVTIIEDMELEHVELQSIDSLEKNRWGVKEPNGGRNVEPKTLDLVIVPMVGGDLQCNRIGYGKGFYDRFLSRVDCPTIGLCFDECVVKEIPTESFDIPLSAIVTQQRIIRPG